MFELLELLEMNITNNPTSLPALSADRQAAGRQSDQTIRTFIQCVALVGDGVPIEE